MADKQKGPELSDTLVSIPEEIRSIELSEEQSELYYRLNTVFSKAGITHVGPRLALLLKNEEQLGRFLNNNKNISVEQLEALWETLGKPAFTSESVTIDVRSLTREIIGNHAKGTQRS